MGSILIALPRLEDSRHISDILKRRGMDTAAICTSGAKVLSTAHELDSGVVICGRRLSDMFYTQLAEYLPKYFEVLLISSPNLLEDCPPGIQSLATPLRASELAATVDAMLLRQAKLLKKQKSAPKKRSESEQNLINQAKALLMELNHMTETEAFRYIQKTSMDSGTNMVETAQKIMLLMG